MVVGGSAVVVMVVHVGLQDSGDGGGGGGVCVCVFVCVCVRVHVFEYHNDMGSFYVAHVCFSFFSRLRLHCMSDVFLS